MIKAEAVPPTVKPLIVIALSSALLVQCRKPTTQTQTPQTPHETAVDAANSAITPTVVAVDSGVLVDVPSTPTAAPAVLTIKIINIGSRPIPIYTNPDTNEMLHGKKLRSRRSADAGRDGEPVKLFDIGQMPLCSDDAGAGYGGLGQPERRELAAGESMSFAWDGMERQERLDRTRGVCQNVVVPAPGRYRIELDQPHRSLRCTDPEFNWPLRPDAPRELEIRCRLRSPDDDAPSQAIPGAGAGSGTEG